LAGELFVKNYIDRFNNSIELLNKRL